MATNKSASTVKKSAKKAAPVARKTTTKVTTVKATSSPASAAVSARSNKFSFSRTPLLGASVAEFIGTFLLAGVVLSAQYQPLFVLVGLAAIILTVGGISGAHFNPALTIGALATKRIKLPRAAGYIVAQVLGAMLALVVMNAFIGAAPAVSEQAAAFGQSAPSLYKAAEIPAGKEWVVLAAELLGATILAFAVTAGVRAGRSVARAGSAVHAFAYAGGLYVAVLVAGTAAQYVGGATIFNPALAVSLQSLSFEVWPLLIYVVTPLVGGVLGFALSDLLKTENETV